MQRLTGFDAGFLYMETPTLHMHTLKISVLDPSGVPGGYTFERFKEVLGERLHLLPPFRRRMVDVPLGLHHPVWIEDPDFDLDYHVRRVQAPAPGRLEDLSAVCSDIASRQLDRRHPLWEISVVEGLEDGHIGFVAKIHHSAADGIAAAEMLANVLDADPDAGPPPRPATPWRPDRVPSQWELLLGALAAILRNIVALPRLLQRTVQGFTRVRAHRKQADVQPPLPLTAPKLSFNGSLTPHRMFVMTAMPLDDFKEVKKAVDGVTLNDVFLAVCAGALRRYLERTGQLPEKALVAGVPVSVRTGEPTDDYIANSVSNMFTALHVEMEDPMERLRATAAVTKEAKAVHKALGADMLMDWSELTPPRPFAGWMKLYSKLRLADRHRPPINLVVSNVPGPREPLYIAGARILDIFSMGPILESIGLNITVWSYLDEMNVGMVSCPELMPDLWDLTADLHDALAELRKAAA
ncbi:MAG: diacylglycerol O-acyltransferase / wax synthase [Actinomycetota bacterium]